MKHKILNWRHANKLKTSKSAHFLMQIDYNLAKVYLLNNWTFLVTPANPFGNSLLTDEQDQVQKWIRERHFPSGDEPGKLNLDQEQRIEDLMACKEVFKKTLCEHILGVRAQFPERLSVCEINDLYKLLHHKRQYDLLKLPFTLLVGDYLISQQEEVDWRWGLMCTRQYLNPLTSLVLVPNENRRIYFDLDELIERKDFSSIYCHTKDIAEGELSQVSDHMETTQVMEPALVAL